MTVSELIKKLETMHPDSVIVRHISADRDGPNSYFELAEVKPEVAYTFKKGKSLFAEPITQSGYGIKGTETAEPTTFVVVIK